jgi:STIP1 family protein 1
MIDPVMLLSGHTYERKNIENHFGESASDPITGKVVNEKKMIDNVGIRKACEEFLARNPWAYQYELGEDYRRINI